MSADASAARIRAWAAARRLPEAHLARWLAMAEADRSSLLEAAERLRLRTGQFVTAFEWLVEIALRDGDHIAAIVASGEIRRLLDGADSTPGRARSFVEQLRTIRFPRLKHAADRMTAALAALALPRGINVRLPHDLSSDELRIEIVAHDGDEMDKLIDALAKNRSGLKRIAAMLGGADEL
jgi:hypothetical protein